MMLHFFFQVNERRSLVVDDVRGEWIGWNRFTRRRPFILLFLDILGWDLIFNNDVVLPFFFNELISSFTLK